jgi:tetratricopeptide (TPR) repeat protein
MLTHLVLALVCLQGEDDKRIQEAKVIRDRAFAAVEEAGKLEGEEQVRAWERAVGEFKKVAKDYPDTRFYGMCHYNVGHILCNELGKYEQAIQELEVLIASKVNDRDSTGALMHPHRNYRYNAWRLITTSYEKLKKPAHAIQAVFRARAAYVADCGTCQMQMRKGTEERLAALAAVIAPAIEAADVAAVLHPPAAAGAEEAPEDSPKDPTAMQFLQVLEQHLREQGKDADAGRILRALADEFPASPEGKAAAKALEQAAKKK